MGLGFEQLSWEQTPMGVLGLRRRFDPTLDAEVYEVKLGDEFLMSSAFTVAEIALAELALAWCADPEGTRGGLDVAVGGLGLGYTAAAVLADPRVRSLVVVEALPEVIRWHRERLLPEVAGLAADDRTRLVQGDLFADLATGREWGSVTTPQRFDAVLIDIDHSPHHVLDASHAGFYTPAGLARLRQRLVPGGVFGLWSDDPPDEDFLALVREVFTEVRAEVVAFDNPFTGGRASNTIYLARVS